MHRLPPLYEPTNDEQLLESCFPSALYSWFLLLFLLLGCCSKWTEIGERNIIELVYSTALPFRVHPRHCISELCKHMTNFREPLMFGVKLLAQVVSELGFLSTRILLFTNQNILNLSGLGGRIFLCPITTKLVFFYCNTNIPDN
uniref:Uncharacterized protein n=1 Tax=Glossina palpalis gambiensis TaxID=67801 RepID=A0A1B0ANU7_9MUSC